MLQAKVLQLAQKWAKMHYPKYWFNHPILVEPRQFGGKPWTLVTVPAFSALRLGIPGVSLGPLALNAKHLDIPSSDGHLIIENGQAVLEGEGVRIMLPTTSYEEVAQDEDFAPIIQGLDQAQEDTVEVAVDAEDVQALVPFRAKDHAREDIPHLGFDFAEGVVVATDGYRMAYLHAFQPISPPHPGRVAVMMPKAFYTQLAKKAVGKIRVRVPTQEESEALPEARGWLKFKKEDAPIAFMVRGEGLRTYPDFWRVSEGLEALGEIDLSRKAVKAIAKVLKGARFAVLVSDQDNKLWLLAIRWEEGAEDFQVIAAQQIGVVDREYIAGFNADFLLSLLAFAPQGKIKALPQDKHYWRAPIMLVTITKAGLVMPHELVGFPVPYGAHDQHTRGVLETTLQVVEKAADWGVQAPWAAQRVKAILEKAALKSAPEPVPVPA